MIFTVLLLISMAFAYYGPTSISNQRTTPSSNRLPTIDQMMYYNYYAAASYHTSDLGDFSCWSRKIKPDLTDYEVINNDEYSTLAIVAISEDREEIVVAFRGSVNFWNVMIYSNVKCDRIPGQRFSENVKIHTGFYILTMSLYADVVQKVSSYLKEHNTFKIVLTGHSMGGALARLTYFFLIDLNQFPDVEYELYTYGEPRVGNKAFADFMNSQPFASARVVARGDIVPHLPPTSVFGTDFLIGDNYVHAQTEFWINGKTNQNFANQSFYEDPNSSTSLGPLYSLLDHFIYFDVNFASGLGQPFQNLSLPLILDSLRDIPSLPKKIERCISDVINSVVRALALFFG